MIRWALVFLTACSHQPLPGESVAEVCTPANHGKIVTVSGSLTPPTIVTSCNETCSMYVGPEAGVRKGVWAVFRVGDQPGQMKAIAPMKNSFAGEVRPLRPGDFQVRGAANRVARAGEVVRVTGRLSFTPDSMFEPCALEVTAAEVVR